MANNLGNLTLDGGDPRIGGIGEVGVATTVRRNMHDPNVPFEEYLYFAKVQREQEQNGFGPDEQERMYQEYLAGVNNVAGMETGDEEKAFAGAGQEKTELQSSNESKSNSMIKAHDVLYV